MRSFLFALALAALTAPVAALAQDATGGQPSGWTHQHSAAFEQAHQQIERLHEQARAQMLASLSPAHKQLVAQIAGQLAISPNPDFPAAVRKLDASLTPSEQQAILRTHEAFKQQMRGVMEAAFKSLPQDQQQQMQEHMQQHHQATGSTERQRPQLTAGALLLMPAHGSMMMMPHPPM